MTKTINKFSTSLIIPPMIATPPTPQNNYHQHYRNKPTTKNRHLIVSFLNPAIPACYEEHTFGN
ncbi:447_t:CDS:2 [Diversispora eburnea]|uniref:447_t:CDS:1 n=1 Tax=Diversispora eburnea TaxID=1213867 RepID=A0A9N8WR84_9GLOM|nr:447_t:CDS:2 [Diversispora eburnea]